MIARAQWLGSIPPLLLLACQAAWAQAPALTHLFPMGARQGTTVTVSLGAKDLPAEAQVRVEGEGITLGGPIKEGKVPLVVAKDARPGIRTLRILTPQGASVPRPFVVGVLPESNESEPNNAPKEAQKLALPVTVNGQILTSNDPDSYCVSLRAGECLIVAAEARRLGAPTDLVLRLLDARGIERATCEDYNDRDPLLAYVAPAAGDYVVQAYDVMTNYSSVNADYTYRLTFTTGPFLERSLTLAVPRGHPNEVTLAGWNLNGKPGPGTVTQTVAVPTDADPLLEVTLPGAPNSVRVVTDDQPGVAEQEPNDDLAHAQPIDGHPTVNGELGRRGDVDVYRIHAGANERFVFAVEAQPLGSALVGVLTLMDTQGKPLAEADNGDDRRDPVLRWTAPSAGEYLLRVRDVGTPARQTLLGATTAMVANGSPAGAVFAPRRVSSTAGEPFATWGSPGFFYRLRIAPPRPELAVTLTEPSPVLTAGDKLELPLKVVRSDGATGEVEIAADGLPAGVTASPLKLPPAPDAAGGAVSTDAKLVLSATPDAAPCATPLRIIARTQAGEHPLAATAIAIFPLATDRSGTVASGTTQQLLLVVKPPKK
jgi:hypothetical protein